jgi:hypothetical protein
LAQGRLDLVHRVAGGQRFQQEGFGSMHETRPAQRLRRIDVGAEGLGGHVRAPTLVTLDQARLLQQAKGLLHRARRAPPHPGEFSHRGQALARLQATREDIGAQRVGDLTIQLLGTFYGHLPILRSGLGIRKVHSVSWRAVSDRADRSVIIGREGRPAGVRHQP